MKTTNVSPPGSVSDAVVRGHIGRRAGTPGPTFHDTSANDNTSPDITLIGGSVSGDDEMTYLTLNATGQSATNDAAVDLAYGDVVVLQADGSVTTTTTPQDTRPVGVVQVPGAVGDPVQVVFSGYVAQINSTGTITAGDFLETSATAGAAQSGGATRRTGSFAQALGADPNPPALLFGVPDTTAPGTALPWFVVTDYGAVGDGTTDDTDAINAAIAAYNTAGGGVLYFPRATGYRVVTGPLTTLTAPGLVLGDGGTENDPASVIEMEDLGHSLFVASVGGVVFRNLKLHENSGDSGASAIYCTDADMVRFEYLSIVGFQVGLRLEASRYWQAIGCYIVTELDCITVENAGNPDQGDWTVDRCTLGPGVDGRGILVDTSGGGRVLNTKINAGNRSGTQGIFWDQSGTDATGILLIEGCSIENVDKEAIRVETSDTATFHSLVVKGNQFGLYGLTDTPAIVLTAASAGGISRCVISGNTFHADANVGNPVIAMTNIDGVRLGENYWDGFSAYYTATTCTDIVDEGAQAPANVNYLVGTASSALSAEIVVGTTPGGELGGTWASPTVDATHSGSTHSAATDAHIADATDAHDAGAISYDNATSGLAAVDVQAAVDELAAATPAGLLTVDPGTITYDNTAPDVIVQVVSRWGYDADGPYFNDAGVTSGEEALLVVDPEVGDFAVIPYNP